MTSPNEIKPDLPLRATADDPEVHFKRAVNKLSDSAHRTLEAIVESSTELATKGIEQITASVVEGIKGIKSELEFTKKLSENPWGIVAGGVAIGATFEYATTRLAKLNQFKDKDVHYEARRGYPLGQRVELNRHAPVVSWLPIAVAAYRLVQSKRSKASDTQGEGHEQ